MTLLAPDILVIDPVNSLIIIILTIYNKLLKY